MILRKQIKRLARVETIEKLPRCIVGMEACLSARFVSLTLRKVGFEPLFIPAIYLQLFITAQKNDDNDAKAALRSNLPVVPEKSEKQPDQRARHRVRSRLATRRNGNDQSDPRLSDRTGLAVRGGCGSSGIPLRPS